MDKIKEILYFWFEGIDDHTFIDKNAPPFKKWFKKDLRFDQEIRQKFEQDLHLAKKGKYQSWENSPLGCLALILLLDQFSRNMYRDSPQAFAYDSLAFYLAKRMIEDGLDKKLPLIYRVFVYMPLTHAEDFFTQEMSVQCFEKFVEEVKKGDPQNAHYFQYNLFYARRHRDIIKKFGRFPHRNAILGRPSTAEELEFLSKNRSF